MKQSLGPLGMVDILTDSELKESLGHNFSRMMREWYRGVDYLGFAGQGNGSSQITIPGPGSGYSWSLKLASVQLSATGTLSVYPSDNLLVAPIGVASAVAQNNFTTTFEAVVTWSSNQAVIKDGRNLTLFVGGAVIANWRLLVQQVPTEMQGKL